MRALSLLQPYASLIAIGAKRIESRSWRTPYRGALAIHASKRFGAEERSIALSLATDYPVILQALRTAGLQQLNSFPCGSIIAVCRLDTCSATNDLTRGLWTGERGHLLSAQETACGDYSAGRYAWVLSDVQPLATPIPCRGALGLWAVPADVEQQIAAQLRMVASS